MTLQRFDPFREMRHFNRRFNHNGLFNHPAWAAQRWGNPRHDGVDHPGEAWAIPMDVHRNGQELTVAASLPGFAADEVDVSISPDRVLSVKASRHSEVVNDGEEYLMRERRFGAFQRAIRLPSDLDLDAAAVALDNGVLTVTLPVAEAAQTRRLPIAAGASVDANADVA